MALLLKGLVRIGFHGSEISLERIMYHKQTPAHQDVDNVEGGHHSGEYGGVALVSQGLSTEKLLAT